MANRCHFGQLPLYALPYNHSYRILCCNVSHTVFPRLSLFWRLPIIHTTCCKNSPLSSAHHVCINGHILSIFTDGLPSQKPKKGRGKELVFTLSFWNVVNWVTIYFLRLIMGIKETEVPFHHYTNFTEKDIPLYRN